MEPKHDDWDKDDPTGPSLQPQWKLEHKTSPNLQVVYWISVLCVSHIALAPLSASPSPPETSPACSVGLSHQQHEHLRQRYLSANLAFQGSPEMVARGFRPLAAVESLGKGNWR